MSRTANRRVTLCLLLGITLAGCGSAPPTSSATTESVASSAESAPTPATIAATTTVLTSLSETSTTVLLDECLRSLPFTPTYLPEGFDRQLRPGDGGEVGVEPDGTIQWIDPPTRYFVNYSAHTFRLGTFINITTSAGEAAAAYEPMTVLGRPAQFGDIEDGYAVVFHTGDSQCDEYTMMTYGVSPEDTRRVAEGLVATS